MLPKAKPPLPASAPKTALPAGACDSHFHMVAGPEEYPRWPERVEDPADGSFADWLERLRQQMRQLGIARGVVVQSILYGTDNRILVDSIHQLGSSHFRGIGLLRDGAEEQKLDDLRAAGITGLRLNYVHGGVLTWPGAKALAPALAERGMHLQILIQSDCHMQDLAADIRALPIPVVVDHIGWPDLNRGLQDPGFQLLCQLLAEGQVWVKLSALFRFCAAAYERADPLVAALAAANPQQCLWGSDWPYLMMADAERPDPGALLDALYCVVSRQEDRQAILVDNPARLYGF
ncbi:MAG: amidohydrolase family protein [Pseudomonadota bacterium]